MGLKLGESEKLSMGLHTLQGPKGAGFYAVKTRHGWCVKISLVSRGQFFKGLGRVISAT